MSISSTKSVFSTAKSYHDGLNIIPIRADGSKQPTIRFKQYLTSRCPWSRVAGLFATDAVGIGIICGETSGNLIIFDWEGRAIREYGQWLQQVRQVVAFLPVVQTPSNGRHVYARLETAEGGEVLAKNEEGKVLVETRGQGHYCLMPGSPISCHKAGKPYLLIQGDLLRIPVLTTRERDLLFDTARAFNRFEKPEAERKATSLRSVGVRTLENERPGDIFNATAEWEDILEPHGWTIEGISGDTTYWRRPGSQHKHSATTGYGGVDVFYCFSTAADPFQPGEPYSKFACYALLNFGGDFSRAAKEVAHG